MISCYRYILVYVSSCIALASPSLAAEQGVPNLVVVQGAAGQKTFRSLFSDWASNWEKLARQNSWKYTPISESLSDLSAKQQLRNAISEHPNNSTLWLVFLGHGTSTAGVNKFNLTGEDVSASELEKWLRSVESSVILVNCSSASGGFVPLLSASNRIIVTATQAPAEINFSRFGGFLSESILSPQADLDHDNSVSLLEAFIEADSQTQRYYKEKSLLATEHAVLEDNGDKKGITGDFYRGITPIKKAKSSSLAVDGQFSQRFIISTLQGVKKLTPEEDAKRVELESAIQNLKNRKDELAQTIYYDQLESLLLELADILCEP